MVADPAMRAVAAAFPALCAASLALPAAAGWLIGGTWQAALAALLWAGLARIALLQHVTWSVNSLCHLVGTRPYATRRHDRATNFWPLAVVSLGESWHNGHHSDPACARHGTGPRQVDLSAAVIRAFERCGWASAVHWPDPARLAARRCPAPTPPQPAKQRPLSPAETTRSPAPLSANDCSAAPARPRKPDRVLPAGAAFQRFSY